MRLRLALAAAAVALLAACGRQGDVTVMFKGSTPTNSKVVDGRSVEFHCPGCGKIVGADVKKCTDKNCAAQISWAKEDRTCAYCSGTGECPTCRLMNQSDGKCYNCRGHGYITVLGKVPQCPNCKGDMKCPMCKKAPGKCDFCEGTGKVALSMLKSKVKAPETEPK